MYEEVQTYGRFHDDGEGHGGRIDVAAGPTAHVKAGVVLETYRGGAPIADIARRHDIPPPHLQAGGRGAMKDSG